MNIDSDNDTLVCYLDVMGYSEIVDNVKDKDQINGLYFHIQNSIKRNFDTTDNMTRDLVKVLSFLQFQMVSDSIIIVLNIKDVPHLEGSDEIQNALWIKRIFLILVSLFCLDFISEVKRLVRGGISFGQYFQRQNNGKNSLNFIFSKAYIRAVALEKQADVPRILIDEDCFRKNLLNANDNLSGIDLFSRCEDGLYMLDLYSAVKLLFLPEELSRLKATLSDCWNGLDKSKKAILRKWYWFCNYHNQQIDNIFRRNPRFHSQKVEDFRVLLSKD